MPQTGLTASCLASTTTMEQVDDLVTAYVSQHFPPDFSMALLAGNSVHADRAFINKDLPKLAEKLHYRILDVSTIKELASRWYPEFTLPSKAASTHRWVLSSSGLPTLKLTFFYRSALSDIEDSIAGSPKSAENPPNRVADPVASFAELKYYRQHLFQREAQP